MTISALATPAAEMGGPLEHGDKFQRAKQLDRGHMTVSLQVTQVPDLPVFRLPSQQPETLKGKF